MNLIWNGIGYGWEMQLLETGFLGIFLAPLLPGEMDANKPPPVPVLYLYKWLIFRIMIGAVCIFVVLVVSVITVTTPSSS